MLLCDTSSMGDGNGDFRRENAPPSLLNLIDSILGRWCGDEIAFVGDYTHVEDHELCDSRGDPLYSDIDVEVASGVWAMCFGQVQG